MIYRNSLPGLPLIPRNVAKVVPDVNNARLHYVGFARYGLFEGSRLLGIGPQDNVLVPAYICRDALEPFLALKAKIRYYKIKDNLSPDLESAEKFIDANTKALLYVNYFGLSNGLCGCSDFCHKNKLYLIEDNAHALFANFDNLQGDICVFSLRKFYPVPNGALLFLRVADRLTIKGNCTDSTEERLRIADYKFVAGTFLRILYAYGANIFTNYFLLKYAKKTRRNLNHEEKQISLNDMSIYKKISKLSLGIINNTHFNYIFNRRRENYIFLHQLLQNVKSNHLQIMFEKTQAGIAPLAFPLVVKERRENLLNYLFLKGFVAYSWPDLPRDIAKNNDYTTENFLSNTMVLLPIHEGMKRRHINKMVLSIEEWAKKFD